MGWLVGKVTKVFLVRVRVDKGQRSPTLRVGLGERSALLNEVASKGKVVVDTSTVERRPTFEIGRVNVCSCGNKCFSNV